MTVFSRAFPGRAPAGRVLAVDYGRRRIGLALSDALGLVARPLATLRRTNRRADLRRLREIAREHDVRRIVVGHPLHLDGGAGEMAAEAARFAARLEKQLGLPVELVDERLSSWEAEQTLAANRALARKRRGRAGGQRPTREVRREGGTIDQVAAAVILRDYLESARKRAKD
jgi:putative Holliday junction resolvase